MGREICCCEKIDDRKRMGRKNFIITSDKNFSLNQINTLQDNSHEIL
tara:strand:- start:295 stop:435 length:141 start_codon:yes stop_codon:yes gene_type:complete